MRLSAHDASFLYTETASGPMHGVGLVVLGGPATYEEIVNYHNERIHLVPRLRQRLAFVPFNLAHPKWVDDPDFDITNHIKPFRVPPNTNMERAFEIALELGEPLLDRNKPLWLTYVMENIEGKTLLAQMSHHAFVDGATAVAMSVALTDTAPDAPPPDPAAPSWHPAPLPNQIELWQEALQENAATSAQEAQASLARGLEVANLTQQATSLMERLGTPVMQAPWNASLVGPKRTVANLAYALDELKTVSKAVGATINDVVVSVVTEGVARYLVAQGEVVADQKLRLMCPVDIRDANEDPLHGGNRVSAMFPIISAEPMDIMDRLRAVQAELNEIKEKDEPRIMDKLQELQPNVPPVALAQTLNAVGSPWDPTVAAARAPLPILPHAGGPRPQQLGFNFTCTNVAGPSWQQYVAGYPVESSTGTLMLSGNLGMGTTVNSYNNKIYFSFTADPRLVPKVQSLADSVATAINDLQNSVRQV